VPKYVCRCGENDSENFFPSQLYTCRECARAKRREYRRSQRRKNRDRGRCRCGKAPVPGHTRCETCLQSSRESSRRAKAKRSGRHHWKVQFLQSVLQKWLDTPTLGEFGEWLTQAVRREDPTYRSPSPVRTRLADTPSETDRSKAPPCQPKPNAPCAPEKPRKTRRSFEAAAAPPPPEPLPPPKTPRARDIQGGASKRRHPTRPKTITGSRILKRQLKRGRAEYPETDCCWKPRTRADCMDGPRPCPFVSCKYHLYLEAGRGRGSIKLLFPDIEPWELGETCLLDVAELGGVTMEATAVMLNLTKERVRQIQQKALAKLEAQPGALREFRDG